VLDVYTSQYAYQGEHRLDVTRKGADPYGLTFAPTWELLMDYKKGRISKDAYLQEYFKLMRKRYRENKPAFEQLLNREKVVLVCFETPEEGFCHRYMLAWILTQLGANYKGELRIDGSFWGTPDLERFADRR
jgi:hypothetical protein